MKEASELIGIACAGVIFSRSSGLVQWFKWYLKEKRVWYKKYEGTCGLEDEYTVRQLKPLDCPGCMAFWLSIVADHSGIPAVLNACICFILAEFITKKLYEGCI